MRRACLSVVALALAAPGPRAEQAVFRGGVDLVTIGVTVTDRSGTLVTDLERDDFTLVEDGRPQALAYFASGQRTAGDARSAAGADVLATLRPGLLLDTSGSMAPDLQLARSAAIRFLNRLPQTVDITLVDFDSEVRVMRYPQHEFPRMVERIRSRRAGGFTALYDALGVYLDGASSLDGRPVLVVYSDGIDSQSTLSFGEVIDLLKASHVTVYAIGLPGQDGRQLHGRATLRAIAETTGGTALFPSSMAELDAFYERMLDEIRAQYQLGYVSTNTAADGRWRAVQVQVRRPGVTVRARKGYYAPRHPPPRP